MGELQITSGVLTFYFCTNNLLLAAQVFVTWTGEGKMYFEIISLGIFREAGGRGRHFSSCAINNLNSARICISFPRIYNKKIQ